MKITATLLKEHHACRSGINKFNAVFPRGVVWKFNDPGFAARVLASPLATYIGWAIDNLPGFRPFHVSAGDDGTATAGNWGTATAGNYGTATAGNHGTATAGYRGIATAGNYGTATAGIYGTATASFRGIATAGEEGTVTAGYEGVLVLKYYDRYRYRFATAYTGENGILPNTPYRLDNNHNFVKANS